MVGGHVTFLTFLVLSCVLYIPQEHYDWGMRTIKSVLVVAGKHKRAEPGLPEDVILIRALRDFNTPKIVQSDQVQTASPLS